MTDRSQRVFARPPLSKAEDYYRRLRPKRIGSEKEGLAVTMGGLAWLGLAWLGGQSVTNQGWVGVTNRTFTRGCQEGGS